jgi:hypothetical protein
LTAEFEEKATDIRKAIHDRLSDTSIGRYFPDFSSQTASLLVLYLLAAVNSPFMSATVPELRRAVVTSRLHDLPQLNLISDTTELPIITDVESKDHRVLQDGPPGVPAEPTDPKRAFSRTRFFSTKIFTPSPSNTPRASSKPESTFPGSSISSTPTSGTQSSAATTSSAR